MNCYKYILLLFITNLYITANSANLIIDKPVETFLYGNSSYTTMPYTKSVSTGVPDTVGTSNIPIAYEIIIPQRSKTDIDKLSRSAGIADSLKKFTGYDHKRGIFYYNSPHLDFMRNESLLNNERLKQKAKLEMQKLLGTESNRFVLANIESDWVKTKSDPVERLLSRTYRFTRKINDYHIIDNTSYVKVSFTGNEQLCGYEICNPDLKPVPINRTVRISSTEKRIRQFAYNKNTVRNSHNEEINVSEIKAQKAVQSYMSETVSNKRMLIPYVSVFCKYQLKNGDSFDKFEHFGLDASRAKDISDEMLEPLTR